MWGSLLHTGPCALTNTTAGANFRVGGATRPEGVR